MNIQNHHVALDKKLLFKASQDLGQDFAELTYLYSSLLDTLQKFQTELEKAKKHIEVPLYKHLLSLAATYRDTLVNYQQQIKQNQRTLQTDKGFTISQLEAAKQLLYQVLRSYTSLIAALITATDWQSPSFLHSLASQAGRQTGQIMGNINDYKRDQHAQAKQFEQLFLKEYVDSVVKFPLEVLSTQSGMAAFTTILTFLAMEQKMTGPILIGSSIYFENKELITKMYRDHIIEVPESNTEKICRAIQTRAPSIILFDSLCNTSDVAVPDLNVILKFATKHAQKETYFVIDNTCLSISYQPFKNFVGKMGKVHLIVFESLNKYYQFGADRTTGGALWTWGKDLTRLFYARVHSGTNISDVAVSMLPQPNRKLLTRRMSRFERNAQFLAAALHTYITNKKTSPFAHVIYPGLPSHPSFAWTQKMPFHGSFMSLQFHKDFQKIPIYRQFIKMVIAYARKQNVNIVTGTSFGFNTTRIYLTAVRTDYGTPFVRISVGTENRLQIEKIKDVLLCVLEQFSIHQKALKVISYKNLF